MSSVGPPSSTLTKEIEMKDINEMTLEELQQAMTEMAAQHAAELQDKAAEIASLTEENQQLKEAAKTQEQELRETKKMNFTLARRMDQGPRESVESLINNLFQRGGKV